MPWEEDKKEVNAPVKAKELKEHHDIHYPLWFGGSASCFAVTLTHPLDLSKFVVKMVDWLLYE